MITINFETYIDDGLSEDEIALKREYLAHSFSQLDTKSRNTGANYIQPHSTLDQFIDLVKEAIDKDQSDKKDKVFFLDNYSHSNIFEDPSSPGKDALGIVGYRLTSRVPGTTAATNRPGDSSRREVRPSLRAVTYDDPSKPKQATFHYGRWYDNMICFEIYARSNKEANDLAMWFEDLMEKYRPFFALNGIMKYHFEERDGDAAKKNGDSVIQIRPLHYWVRTEKTYEIDEHTINNILVNIKTT